MAMPKPQSSVGIVPEKSVFSIQRVSGQDRIMFRYSNNAKAILCAVSNKILPRLLRFPNSLGRVPWKSDANCKDIKAFVRTAHDKVVVVFHSSSNKILTSPRFSKLVNFPNSVGTVPVIKVWEIDKVVKLVKSPKVVGMVPRRFVSEQTNVSANIRLEC